MTSYDSLGRPGITFQRHMGTTTSLATKVYSGFTTTSTSAEGSSRKDTTDAYGQLAEVRELTGSGGSTYATTAYGYTRAGDLKTIDDTAGNHTAYGYDLLRRRTTSDDPDAGHSTSTYDADGNVIEVQDALGNVVHTDFDDLGRPTKRSVPGGATLAEWSYWTATDTPATNIGLPKTTTSYDGTNAYTATAAAYDDMGRATTSMLTVPASAGTGLAGTYTSTTTYNSLGAPVTATLPAVADLPAEQLTYGYTDRARPTTLTSVDDPGTPGASHTYVASTSFDQNGRLNGRAYGTGTNQLTRGYGYTYDANANPQGALRSVTSTLAGSPAFQLDTYSYDDDGNVTAIADGAPSGGGQSQCFAYDKHSRLVDAWTTDSCDTPATAHPAIGPDPYKQHFAYDAIDNLTSIAEGTASTTTRTYSYATTGKPHAVSSVATTAGTGTTSYTYDANGAQATKAVGGVTSTDTWDVQHHLTSVSDGTAATTSVYASDGTRLLRKAPDGSGGTTTTLYLGSTEVTRANAGTTTARRTYTSGTATVAQRDAAGTHWMLADTQGSAQISVDAGTTTVHRQRYLPYGGTRGAANQLPTDHDYLGKVKDDTTGLIQMGARYYDPDLAKFISVDPLTNLSNPQTLNPYTYALANPTTRSDPSGLWMPGSNNGGTPEVGWNPGLTTPNGGDDRPKHPTDLVVKGDKHKTPPRERQGPSLRDRLLSIARKVGSYLSTAKTTIAEAICGEKEETCKKLNPSDLAFKIMMSLRHGIVSELLQTEYPGYQRNPDYVVLEGSAVGADVLGGGVSLIFTRNGSVYVSPEAILGSAGNSVVARVGYINRDTIASGPEADAFVQGGAVTISANGTDGDPGIAYNISYSDDGKASASFEVGTTVLSDSMGLSASISYSVKATGVPAFSWEG